MLVLPMTAPSRNQKPTMLLDQSNRFAHLHNKFSGAAVTGTQTERSSDSRKFNYSGAVRHRRDKSGTLSLRVTRKALRSAATRSAGTSGGAMKERPSALPMVKSFTAARRFA